MNLTMCLCIFLSSTISYQRKEKISLFFNIFKYFATIVIFNKVQIKLFLYFLSFLDHIQFCFYISDYYIAGKESFPVASQEVAADGLFKMAETAVPRQVSIDGIGQIVDVRA